MSKLYRFAADGRYLGFLVQDRPIAQYADRLEVDLCEDEPEAPPSGSWPYCVAGAWVMQLDPPRPAPPTPAPPAPAPAP